MKNLQYYYEFVKSSKINEDWNNLITNVNIIAIITVAGLAYHPFGNNIDSELQKLVQDLKFKFKKLFGFELSEQEEIYFKEQIKQEELNAIFQKLGKNIELINKIKELSFNLERNIKIYKEIEEILERYLSSEEKLKLKQFGKKFFNF